MIFKDELKVRLEKGVNILTGTSSSGKTTLCKAIAWGLSGTRPEGCTVKGIEIYAPGIGVITRRSIDGTGASGVSLVSETGTALADFESVLGKAGVKPVFYQLGIEGLYSRYYMDAEPPVSIMAGGKPMSIVTLSLAACNDAIGKYRGAREELQSIVARSASMQAELEKEIDELRRDISSMKEREQAQFELSYLALMESKECPLYQLTCTCRDESVELVKEDIRQRTEGVVREPDFASRLAGKERALSEKQLRLLILSENLIDGNGNTVNDRLVEIESRIALGKQVIAAVEKREKWLKSMSLIKPYINIKDALIALATAFGVQLAFSEKFLLNGQPVECGSRAEHVVLSYCLQMVACLPVILVDNFDVLDRKFKQRVIDHAISSMKTVLFIAASTEPRKLAGTHSWHLGIQLEKAG